MEYFISCRERIWEESQVLHQNYIFLKLKRRINVHYHPGISRATPPIPFDCTAEQSSVVNWFSKWFPGDQDQFSTALLAPYFPSSQYFIQDGHRLHFMQYAFFLEDSKALLLLAKLTIHIYFLIDYFSEQPLLFCIL